MSYKLWTVEESLKLESLIKNGDKSFKEIGTIMNRSSCSCQSQSSFLGLSNKYIRRKYSVNHNFWSNQNLINCYWAGFSAADASIDNRSNYVLELGVEDENHLKQLFVDCECNAPIKNYPSSLSTIKGVITSSKWKTDLKNIFNIEPNKTQRLMPPTFERDEYKLAWLIGYIDGDGCIHAHKISNDLSISFVSSSEQLIKYLNNLCDDLIPKGIRQTVNIYHKNKIYNCWHYSLRGIRAIKLFNLLKDVPVPKLKRKWENPKVINAIQKRQEKFPEYFI